MARIVRTPVSRLDIVEILLYLRARNRRAARLVHQAINNTITFLAEHPGAGQRRDEFAVGLRSFPVNRYRNYLVFYRPCDDGIQVIRVLHGARDLPKDLKGR
jgi:toxin ParE1/3/4